MGNSKPILSQKLSEKGGNLEDTFNSQKLKIFFDEENQCAEIYTGTGAKLPAITLNWLAWYAFHPETAVFK